MIRKRYGKPHATGANETRVGTENGIMKALTARELHANRLQSEIAQLEARYDGVFPPSVYLVLERLRWELAALNKAL